MFCPLGAIVGAKGLRDSTSRVFRPTYAPRRPESPVLSPRENTPYQLNTSQIQEIAPDMIPVQALLRGVSYKEHPQQP